MRVSDLISMGQQYLGLGITAVLVMAIGLFLAYYLGYKKALKGQRKLNISNVLWYAVFVCYLFVVIGVTLINRGGGYENQKIMPLFYSYKEAWVDSSVVSWRNIILNICMFIPLGFWLPLGVKSFRKAWRTYLSGFIFTVFIELTQLVFSLGRFELDDMLNNTVGAMIGYGIFVIVYAIYNRFKKSAEDKVVIKRVAAVQLPLVITVVTFGVIFVTYANQEFGNINCQYISEYNEDELNVTTTERFSEEDKTLPVYKALVLSKDDTMQFANQMFTKLGEKIDEERNDFYSETAVYYSEDNYCLWVYYNGGIYELTDFDTTFPEPPLSEVTDASEEEIREALIKYDITIPEDAEFTQLENGEYEFTADMVKEDSEFIDGTLTCKYYENGCFSIIRNYLMHCAEYKEATVISEKEAYEKILSGKFRYMEQGQLDIEVGTCEIEYVLDSKGYYQPVYVFNCKVNDTDQEIKIPAIK